jgi:autotransporter-associated beta strand protein
MNPLQKLCCAFLAAFSLGAGNMQAQTYTHYLTAITSGNWNSAGVQGNTTDGTPTDYQIGYSSQLPNEQAAYFEFDLTPIQGQTVTDCLFLIPGSTDYNITDYWGTAGINENNLNDHQQFKVGVRPQGSDTLNQILNGNNSTTIYLDAADANRNQDLGYGWVAEGLHLNRAFGAFTYNTARLQTEVNTGGLWIFWACDDYDTGAGDENYIWGTTEYNTGLVLEITTTTPPAGTPPPLLTASLANGTYAVISQSTGLALDVTGSGTANGTLVDTWPYDFQANDQWTVTSLGNDSYEVIGVQSGKALEVQGQSVTAGAPADISSYANEGSQQWVITPGVDPDTFTIQGVADGDFLAPTAQGQASALDANDGNPDQEWQFQPTNYTPPLPAAPATLTATPGNTQVELGWSAVAGVTGYTVLRGTATGGPYATIGATGGVSYTDHALTNGTTYYYVVAGVSTSGTGTDSPEANATPSRMLPLAPAELAATGSTQEIILTWQPSAGATGYTIYQSSVSGGPYSALASGITVTTATNTGLPPVTTYYYVVAANDAAGSSAYSPEASATTLLSSIPLLTWDDLGASPADPADGSGTWDTTTTSWSNGASDMVWANGGTTGAVFGNGNGAAGTVTVGNVTAGGLVFNAPGSGSYTLTGGTLTLSGSAPTITANVNATIASVISGTGTVMLGGTGEITLSGANSCSGLTTISPATTLVVGNADALQDTTLDFSSGNLIFAPGTTAATFGGLQGTDTGQNLVLSNTNGPVALSLGGNDASTIYSDNLSGPGSLTETGPGSITLTDANYTGATTVEVHSTLTISGGSFGSPGSQIYVGNPTEPGTNAVATLDLTGGLAIAGAFDIGVVGNETGSSASITGSASGSFGSVQIGSGSNTGGGLTISTTGTVGLGAYAMGRDGSSGGGANTNGGLIVNAGTVTATSILSAVGVSGRTADINLNGGSLTVGSSASTGAFQLTSNVGAGSGAGNGTITQTGGSLTYLGTDGLLCDTQNDNSDTDVSTFTITGATSVDTFTGITLNAASAATATAHLSVSGGATLYLGSVGLVLNLPGSSVSASFGTATIGTAATWSSSAPIALAGTATFQTADASGVAHNITLSGVLSGAGGLTETGSGTLILSGDNTYTGPTNVLSGILEITGSLPSTSSLTVASGAVCYLAGGSLSVSGAVTNNGIFKLSGTTTLTAGSFVNNGVLDLINGPQTLPINFTNSGTVLFANSVQVRQLAMSGSNFSLSVQGYALHTYQLQRATSLAAPVTWTNVGAAQAGTGSSLVFSDPSVPAGQGFYRIQVSP